MLKLSIITINYNNVDGLKRTVESVLNQTWQEFEFIVIDGASTDGSAIYLKSQSDNIDYWISEPDKGIYNAMNKGILQAKGEYLLFLNSGDHLFDKWVIEKNKDQLANFDLIYFDLQIISFGSTVVKRYPRILRFSDMYYGSLPHPSTLIKGELLKKIGLFDESLKIVSDWKFFIIALFKYNCSYKKVNQTFSTFYLDGISSDIKNKSDLVAERNMVLNEYFAPFLLDYREWDSSRIHTDMNRYKMLIEIEKTMTGRKIVSFFFRVYIVLFSKNKIKDIIKTKQNNLF